MIGTTILYLIILFTCIYFTNWSKKRNTKIGIYLGYSLLLFFSLIRFDIGNDYDSYAYWIKQDASFYSFGLSFWKSDFFSKEFSYYFLTYLFHIFEYPYVFVLGIYSIITFYFLYKTFKKNDSHNYSIMVTIISGFLFVLWDQVRQGAAISIILYAASYIEEKNFKKYVFYILLAALFHYSALILLPFYYVKNIKPYKYIYIFIILTLALSDAAFNYFEWIYFNIISVLPYYETTIDAHTLVQITSVGYKIRTIFYSLVWSAIIYFLPDKDRTWINLLFIGAVIFIMASGALNVMRVSFYFIYTMVISIPIVLKTRKARYIMWILVFGLFLVFIHDVVTNTNTRGCVPYDSVFSNNFIKQTFRR